MAARDREGSARRDVHRDTKTGKTDITRHLTDDDKARIMRDKGADFVNVTEIIIKYEILRQGQQQPIRKEISLDPGAFDSIVLSPQKCDQIDVPPDGGRKNHRVLKADGSGKNWDDLKRTFPGRIDGPRDSQEKGRFNSGHSPLCIHDEACSWYCVLDGDEEHFG
jgi:hypothetical protein